MIIKIRQPLCFREQGRKANQEDNLYPLPDTASTSDKYFLVCDGVGGSDHGEVASSTVSKAIGDFLNNQEIPDGVLTEEIFNQALDYAYNSLDAAYAQYAESFKKMSTTLTFLGIHRGGCLIAHIGDSRVYHIRPGVGILSKTNDHSLVNDLLKAGELTPEQAKNFKQKNVITRALQPLMESRSPAELTPVLQVEAGDYFFLCCDGVLEHLEEETLVEILSDKAATDAQKLAAIKKVCDDGDTYDNYTCYLVPIDEVESEPDFEATLISDEVVGVVELEPEAPEEESIPAASIPEINTNIPPVVPVVSGAQPSAPARKASAPSADSSNYMKYIAIALFIALLACVAFIVFYHGEDEDADKSQQTAPVPVQPAQPQPAPTGGTTERVVVREVQVQQPATPANTPAKPAQGGKNQRPVSVTIPAKPGKATGAQHEGQGNAAGTQQAAPGKETGSGSETGGKKIDPNSNSNQQESSGSESKISGMQI